MSPYSGYNGQLLTSVYQPTEMALMHKGPVSVGHRAQPQWVSREGCVADGVWAGAGGREKAGISIWCISLREPRALLLMPLALS